PDHPRRLLQRGGGNQGPGRLRASADPADSEGRGHKCAIPERAGAKIRIEKRRGELMRKTIAMEFERATKRTFPFKEQAPEGEEAIGTLYVQKRVFEGKEPKSIKITIEAGE